MSPKKSKKKEPKISSSSNWILNKYVLSFAAFIAWIGFFDNHNLFKQSQMTDNIESLEKEIHHYNSKLGDIKQEEKDLANNIEKLAREKYKFGAPNEDIFIIEPKEKQQ